VKDDAGGGIVLDNADTNLVANNEVMQNGTGTADTTDGIRVEITSTGNTIRHNQVRNNVTHDCHDDSPPAANAWLNNHGGTENRPGLCNGTPATMTLEATTAFGWDPNYPWYDAFGDAAGYDWALAYAGIDTDGLLQVLPAIPVGIGGRGPASPHP
jgi:hypothetical protein